MADIDDTDYGVDYFEKPDEAPQINLLFERMCAQKDELAALYQQKKDDYWVHGFYRFYHGSFKVYGVQIATKEIVATFRALMPEYPLHEDFELILSKGTGLVFSKDVNRKWAESTSPMVLAYWHAMMFLECMLVCIEEMDTPRCTISEEWGTVLHLYNLRSVH